MQFSKQQCDLPMTKVSWSDLARAAGQGRLVNLCGALETAGCGSEFLRWPGDRVLDAQLQGGISGGRSGALKAAPSLASSSSASLNKFLLLASVCLILIIGITSCHAC